jgi:hypothetical protein
MAVSFLRGYRGRNVPLQRMRPFIEQARAYWQVPYPLAHFKPLVDGKELVYDMQREADLPPSLYLIRPADRGGEMQWAQPVQEFLAKVEFAPNQVLASPAGAVLPPSTVTDITEFVRRPRRPLVCTRTTLREGAARCSASILGIRL